MLSPEGGSTAIGRGAATPIAGAAISPRIAAAIAIANDDLGRWDM
jgi:hypothetical protein